MDRWHGRVPGCTEAGQPSEKRRRLEFRRTYDARACGKRGEQSGDQAVGMRKRLHVDQPVPGFKRKRQTRMVGRMTNAKLGQRDQLWLRCTARSQKDKGVVLCARPLLR